MKDAKLVSFRSAILVQDWITFKAWASEEKNSIMNSLAEEKYSCLKSQLINTCITSDILKDMVTLIFDKAVLEPTFCPMYAQLCYDIHDKLPSFRPAKHGESEMITFNRILLNLCQTVFEGADELSEEIRKMDSPDHKAEREDKEILSNLRTLGNLRLVGELFKLRMVTQWIVQRIIKKLLGDDKKMCPPKEKLEAVSLFLHTVGKVLDRQTNDECFKRLKNLLKHPRLVLQSAFVVQYLIDLRSNNWVPTGK
ncbi:PREDICTED: eukaryotic translation initiation factor-like [Camelina sativa]|uniref:Eukaryotic translation initiation factor-like n=1 Tax=Camelina sativa TaxID=90675 RepID=A0ABM0SZ45_CAMSA|nr:PREDICTED: eukaryotic translation initiation factor-like [Camelina sativa]